MTVDISSQGQINMGIKTKYSQMLGYYTNFICMRLYLIILFIQFMNHGNLMSIIDQRNKKYVWSWWWQVCIWKQKSNWKSIPVSNTWNWTLLWHGNRRDLALVVAREWLCSKFWQNFARALKRASSRVGTRPITNFSRDLAEISTTVTLSRQLARD